MKDNEKQDDLEKKSIDNSESDKEKQPEKKQEVPVTPKNKEGSFKPIIFVMIASLIIALFWDKLPFIKNTVDSALSPTAGSLIMWNLHWGMLIIILIITLITTLIQKYATDQKALRELKKEQKILQQEMKKYKNHPEKVAELSKKQFEFIPKTFKLTSRSILFTGIPFILFFRWFNDFFAQLGNPKFFGLLSWFLFYLIFTMVFSSILRKVFKVV